MITEFIMHRMEWTDVWYAHPGPNSLRRLCYWRRFVNRWHVGVLTGWENDLICIKWCTSNEKAELCLSPGSSTILTACLRSLIKRALLYILEEGWY